jgi:cytochrome c oxidase subunit I+III
MAADPERAVAAAVPDQNDPAVRRAQEARLRAVWASPRGVFLCWTDTNNDAIGKWYTLAALAMMLFAGTLALVMRAQLAVPDNDFVSASTYNQLFTLHGSTMMFLFAVPIFEAVAILILPALLGARDLPFPRLSAFGFWSFAIGGVFVTASIFFDAAPDGGWFMYPPLATEPAQSGIGADIWMLGLSFVEVSSIAAAVELIVGVLKCRPPGMRLNLMPLYAWYVLVVAVMILFAFPPLIAGDILFELERIADWPFFDATRGGDALLWQHLFWIFGHPEVYIIFLPSIAIFAMVVPTFSRRHLLGYPWVVLAAVGTGFLSFGLWVHHMFATGMPALSQGFFSAASEAVAIPTAVQIFTLLATVWAGELVRSTPMLFGAGALAIFVIGGLTGVMVAVAPFDWQAHDTYFVVAHLHYVLVGGAVMPLFGGLYYYWPLVTGKKLSDRLGRIAFWLMFVGFNVGFFPMHLSGLTGMPRRVYTYPSGLGLDGLNFVSTIGAFLFAAGVAVILVDLCLSPRRTHAPRNPWNAGTLEWLAHPRRDEDWGVRSVPLIESRYPIWDQPDFVRNVDEGRHFLPDAEEGKRELMITSVLDAKPLHIHRVATPSVKPMLAAATLGGVFIATTYHRYVIACAFGVAAFVTIVWWLWTGTSVLPEKRAKHAGLGLMLPLQATGPASSGWWAMFIAMMADTTAFASLVFGYGYYWTIHPQFPPDAMPGLLPPGWQWPAFACVLVGAGWLAMLAARSANGHGLRLVACVALSVAAIATGAGGIAILAGPWLVDLEPRMHAYAAIVWVLACWIAAHAALGVVMQLYALARGIAGHMTREHDGDLRNVTLYAHFLALQTLVAFVVVGVFPALP